MDVSCFTCVPKLTSAGPNTVAHYLLVLCMQLFTYKGEPLEGPKLLTRCVLHAQIFLKSKSHVFDDSRCTLQNGSIRTACRLLVEMLIECISKENIAHYFLVVKLPRCNGMEPESSLL